MASGPGAAQQGVTQQPDVAELSNGYIGLRNREGKQGPVSLLNMDMPATVPRNSNSDNLAQRLGLPSGPMPGEHSQDAQPRDGIAGLFPKGAPIVTTADAFAALTAFAVGNFSGDGPLIRESVLGMEGNRQNNIDTLFMLGTMGRGTRAGNNAPTLSQVRTLRDIGVSQEGRRAFFNGETVQFRYPTVGGEDVYGFLQSQDGRLTSQLFSINNTAGGAPAAFRKFVSDSQSIARSLGLSEVELQGGSVINPDLAKALASRGFQPKTVPVPDVLGGGTQEVLYKTINVKPR